jgi:deoxyribodipyrimidine photo-lyase
MTYRRYRRAIVWMRRDLRLSDNRALYEAARSSETICLAFVLDPALLANARMGAPLAQAFFEALAALRAVLRKRGSDVALLEGVPDAELVRLARRIEAEAVFYNEDYEPDAVARDLRAHETLREAGLDVRAWTDLVYFGAREVVRSDGAPYKVFTPYKRRWLDLRALAPRTAYESEAAIDGRLIARDEIGATRAVPAPEDFGLESSRAYPHVSEGRARVLLERFLNGPADRYRECRDLPASAGTSKLSPQLRAGTIGIRTCVERAFALLRASDPPARAGVDAWIGELIWRDFYQMVLATWPHVAAGPFVARAERIAWRTGDADFDAWCEGRTGYPIVDAAMRQLNEYGWMHNRLRMIVASFLAKDLLVDWRRGERYFERHLADADLAANNGGWQWSASTGTDAVPYFRMFNPVVQGRRIDPAGTFVRRLIPALRRVPAKYVHAPWEMPLAVAREAGVRLGVDYPAPIVELQAARARALRAFSVLKGERF